MLYTLFFKQTAFIITLSLLLLISCNKINEQVQNNNEENVTGTTTPIMASYWLTSADGKRKFEQQLTSLPFGKKANTYPTITIDPQNSYQEIDGFGYTLTGGSAQLIQNLEDGVKKKLLQDLFGTENNGIGISYLRVSIGASDLDATVFSYCDLPEGETDLNLETFSLDRDRTALIPLLKEILAINPDIKIMGSPWSAPVWMKDNKHSVGGSLLQEYFDVYSQYFVKYVEEMAEEGIRIDAITPQNEPLHPGNNPSMYMPAIEQSAFIKNHLGPAFENAGIDTKIVIYDHNCDKPEYPISILNDAHSRPYIDGAAFHLYGGEISALSKVHTAHPDKNIYFTEQWTSGNGDFETDLVWHIENVIVGSMRNWSRVALEWNLANDQNFGPHTPGGCTSCQGAITISGSSAFTKNVSYYIIAHASKFIRPGSVRIGSGVINGLQNAAFETPDGHYALVVVNSSNNDQLFNVKIQGEWFTAKLNSHDVATFTWE